MRTVGTTQDPVRYLYVDLPAGPPAAHELLPADQDWGRRPPRKPAVFAAQTALYGSSCDFGERPVLAHA